MKEKFCCGEPSCSKTKKVAPIVSAPLHLILRVREIFGSH